MKYRLAAVRVCVDHDAIAGIGKPLFTRDLSRRIKEMPERTFMFAGSFIQRRNVLARDDENVRRRLRAEVVKGDTNIVLVDLLRGNLARRDLTKNTLAHALARGLLGLFFAHTARDPFDVGTQAAKFANDGLITAVDVIDAIDHRLAGCT